MVSTNNGVFVTKSGELSAEQYGSIAVFNAIDISFTNVTQIIGKNETAFKRAISFNPKVLQLHFIALHVAVMHVYAARFLAVPEGTLKEIYKGITSGFNSLLKDGGISVDDTLLDLLERVLRIYIISLVGELNERNAVAKDAYDGNFIKGSGSTASAFVDAVARSYGDQLQLQENSADDILLKYHVAAAGIVLLNQLWGDQYFTYRDKVEQMNPAVPQPIGRASPKSIPGHTPLTTGNKIFLVVFGVWLLLGAMKIFFKY